MIIFDLDGTLALNDHRIHFIDRPVGERDWDAFHEACDLDLPNEPIIHTLHSLRDSGRHIEIWTGRTERVQYKTEIWLQKYDLRRDVPLKMRPSGEQLPDFELKKQWMDNHKYNIFMTFEDRDSVVKMWRDNGAVCCQVQPGDF